LSLVYLNSNIHPSIVLLPAAGNLCFLGSVRTTVALATLPVSFLTSFSPLYLVFSF
jgi:hypothetical protein